VRRRRTNRKIALERIHILFRQALETCHENPSRAQRYVDLARSLGMRYKVRLPRIYRRMICRGCKRLIVPGISARVRIQQRREPHIVVTCLHCGRHNRMPIKRRRD